MEVDKFNQLVALHLEGKTDAEIAKSIGKASGIVNWVVMFIKAHGVESAKLFNAGLGRGSYTRDEILGIHNYVLRTGCGYQRAEIYFKICRNKLLKRVKTYLDDEQLQQIVPNAPAMQPLADVERLLREEQEELAKPRTTKVVTLAVDPDKAAPHVFGRATSDIKLYKTSKKRRGRKSLAKALEAYGLASANESSTDCADAATSAEDASNSSALPSSSSFEPAAPDAASTDVAASTASSTIADSVAATQEAYRNIYERFLSNSDEEPPFSRRKIVPPKVTIADKIEFYLGPYPKRVPASSFNPGPKVKLPRIDSNSRGFEELPEHLKKKIYERELLEQKIRQAATNLICDDDKVDIDQHTLMKWRFKAVNYLKEHNPKWPVSLIKLMLNISSNMYCYYKNNVASIDPYEEIRPIVKKCFHENHECGHRPLMLYLREQYGVSLSAPVVSRLMKECGLVANLRSFAQHQQAEARKKQ